MRTPHQHHYYWLCDSCTARTITDDHSSHHYNHWCDCSGTGDDCPQLASEFAAIDMMGHATMFEPITTGDYYTCWVCAMDSLGGHIFEATQ